MGWKGIGHGRHRRKRAFKYWVEETKDEKDEGNVFIQNEGRALI